MKAIFGLGNPGLRFRGSRHNLGFLVVAKLAKLKRIKITRKSFHCLFGEGKILDQELLLAEPLTFVNLSGQAVAAVIRHKGICFKDLLIICDDVNLPLGKIRIRAKGSAGGHQGLRSIIQTLGSENFARLRIGVGAPQAKPTSAQDEIKQLSKYVLGNFNRREMKVINEALEKATRCSELWAKKGIASAMNRFNQKGD